MLRICSRPSYAPQTAIGAAGCPGIHGTQVQFMFIFIFKDLKRILTKKKWSIFSSMLQVTMEIFFFSPCHGKWESSLESTD